MVAVMERLPAGVRRFLSDLRDPRLMVIKALYFTSAAAVFLLWPLFTIHQEELGLTTYQTGVCSAAVAAVNSVVPLLSGFLGDKLGNYKKLLCVITLLSSLMTLLFTVIPDAKMNASNTNVKATILNTTHGFNVVTSYDATAATSIVDTKLRNTSVVNTTTTFRNTSDYSTITLGNSSVANITATIINTPTLGNTAVANTTTTLGNTAVANTTTTLGNTAVANATTSLGNTAVPNITAMNINTTPSFSTVDTIHNSTATTNTTPTLKNTSTNYMTASISITTTAATVTTTATDNTTITNSAPTSSAEIMVDPEKLAVTFWVYLAVWIIWGTLYSVGYTLSEAAIMAHIQETGADFGFQRVWITLAIIIATSLSGHILEATGTFNVLFYVSGALQVVSAGLVLLLDLEFKLPAQRLTREIVKQVWRAEVIMFFSTILIAGVFFGYIETFMYRYLSSLGAPTTLISLTITMGAPFELVLTLLTSCMVRRVGYAPLIMIGLFSHSIRLLGYSLLSDPWWVLPLEVVAAVAIGLLMTASMMYCTELFSLQAIAFFRGLFSALYFGLGSLLGAMVGADMREALGDVPTFRILSVIALFSSLIYASAFFTAKKKCCPGSFLMVAVSSDSDGDYKNGVQLSDSRTAVDNPNSCQDDC